IVPLNVGPPHPCQLEGVKQTASGCIIKEVTFIGVGRVDIDEIRFRNCHTGFISIRVRYAQQPQHPPPPPSASSGGRRSAAAAAAAASPGEWRTCLHRRRLMPDPHSELGGLAQFRFGQPDWQAPVTGVAAVRLVLMQPSPVWREFGIEALQIVRRHAGGPSGSAFAAPADPLARVRCAEDDVGAGGGGGGGGLARLPGMSRRLAEFAASTAYLRHRLLSSAAPASAAYESGDAYDVSLLHFAA
ncbi:hypothetical protein BOX15_Mlig033480g3, partial [Macrostomum lignano]